MSSVVHPAVTVPYPTSSPSPDLSTCVYGSSGSDVSFIAANHMIKAIVSDSSFEEAPYRYILPDVDDKSRDLSGRCGDRLEDGKIVYTDSKYSERGRGRTDTRIVIDSGRGRRQLPVQELYEGDLSWMNGLMAYGSIEVDKQAVTTNLWNRHLLLFDIGRGKIEVAHKMTSARLPRYYTSVAGVLLQPKIALLSIENTPLLADMRTRTTTFLQKVDNDIYDAGQCATAGCRIFFPLYEYGHKEPNNKEQVLVEPYLGDRCLKIYPNNDDGMMTLENVYAWSPAQGPLAMTIREYNSHSTTTARLFDTRRHVSFEVPGSRTVSYTYYPIDLLRNPPIFAPTHIAGQPCLTMITGKGVYMIM